MHKPLSESVPPQFTASPFTPALSQSSPQHAQLGFVNLASHPHVHKPKPNAAHRATTISPPPLTAPSSRPRSAGGSHGHGSIPSRTNTSTSGTQTCTASTPAPTPTVAAASSWRSRHKFGQRPSSPKWPWTSWSTQADACTWFIDACVPESSTHSMDEPNEPVPSSRPGFPKTQQSLEQTQKRQPPPPPPLRQQWQQ